MRISTKATSPKHVLDSLLVIRDLIFCQRKYTKKQFAQKLFQGDEAFLQECRRHPVHHGIDDPDANAFANRLTTDLYSYLDANMKALVMGYMASGGIQMQVTCIDPKLLQEAYENPELHRNLVVRVGGYSDYFCNLSDELKRMVIARNVHK